MSVKCTMILGDGLEIMNTLRKASVRMCFADVPFGVTDNDWDKKVPFSALWGHLTRVCVPNAAHLFAATMPFGVDVVQSNRAWFRYDLVWTKTCATGFLNAAKMPLRKHESILVFYRHLPVYNPIKTITKKTSQTVRRPPGGEKGNWRGGLARETGRNQRMWRDDGTRHPVSVISCVSAKKQTSMHPTQKPVALLDWLIRTYSNPGDTVLDPVSGSFTTCVSACQNGRSSVGIEKDPGYFEIGVERVRKHVRDNNLDVKIEVRR